MLKITLEDYRKIHRDFRGIWPANREPMNLAGKRTAFRGSLGLDGPGTGLAFESVDFEIIKPARRTRKGE